MTSHILYAWHNIGYIWHLTHILWHQNTLFMTSKLLYLTSHKLYLTLSTVSVLSHWDYQSYNPHFMYDIYLYHTSYDIKTTISHIWPTISDIAFTVSVSSHPLYWWHHTKYIRHQLCMYDIICTIKDITSTLYCIIPQCLWHQSHWMMTSHPLYMTSYPLYLCHHTHIINNITPSVYVTSNCAYILQCMNFTSITSSFSGIETQ